MDVGRGEAVRRACFWWFWQSFEKNSTGAARGVKGIEGLDGGLITFIRYAIQEVVHQADVVGIQAL